MLIVLSFLSTAYASPLPAYPNARLVLSIDEHRQNHPVITNRMKRVNGVVTSDGAKWLDGHLIRNLYLLPPGHSSNLGYEFYVNLLRGQDVKTLFECRSFSCGASNFWANDIFSLPTLYGQDKEQAFYIGKKQDGYYVVYSVRRGNGRIYTLVDVFRPNDYKAPRTADRHVSESIMSLTADHKDFRESPDTASFIEAMTRDPAMNALLILHSSVPETLAEFDAHQKSMEALQRSILKDLKAQGVSQSRLRFTISIGTYNAPGNREGRASFWLEVVPIN